MPKPTAGLAKSGWHLHADRGKLTVSSMGECVSLCPRPDGTGDVERGRERKSTSTSAVTTGRA